jgi:hypothetical protein
MPPVVVLVRSEHTGGTDAIAWNVLIKALYTDMKYHLPPCDISWQSGIVEAGWDDGRGMAPNYGISDWPRNKPIAALLLTPEGAAIAESASSFSQCIEELTCACHTILGFVLMTTRSTDGHVTLVAPMGLSKTLAGHETNTKGVARRLFSAVRERYPKCTLTTRFVSMMAAGWVLKDDIVLRKLWIKAFPNSLSIGWNKYVARTFDTVQLTMDQILELGTAGAAFLGICCVEPGLFSVYQTTSDKYEKVGNDVNVDEHSNDDEVKRLLRLMLDDNYDDWAVVATPITQFSTDRRMRRYVDSNRVYTEWYDGCPKKYMPLKVATEPHNCRKDLNASNLSFLSDCNVCCHDTSALSFFSDSTTSEGTLVANGLDYICCAKDDLHFIVHDGDTFCRLGCLVSVDPLLPSETKPNMFADWAK